MACTVSSEIKTYLCSAEPEKPPHGWVYSPYVEMDMKYGTFKVDCGNKSHPQDPHKMVISSMQYGLQQANGGMKVDFELLGEGSQAYENVVKLLNKTIKLASTETIENKFRFGWLLTDCDGVTEKKLSEWIHFMPKKLFTNIDKGITKIKLECVDLLQRHNDRRIENNQGTEGNLKTLKKAIRDMCNAEDPPVKVDFINRDGGELMFEINPEGIEAVWKSNELPLLSVIRNWVSTIKTVNKLGVYFKYDPSKITGPRLIIHEDDSCKPDEICNCEGSEKSFIVNGGNCSPVIEFSPEIEWILDAGGFGGISGGGNSGQLVKNKEDPKLSPIENSGSGNAQALPSEYDYTIPQEARPVLLEKTTAAQTTANKPFDQARSIKGDLSIIGNIEYANLLESVGRYVSITVISPFSIGSPGSNNCDVWLANPPLNKILSNKKWMIMGVDHQIEAGKYITKLSVSLPVPNAELSINDPIGGKGSGGIKVDGVGTGTFAGETN